jgi:diaminopropionate ammonia-lyase
LAEGRCGDQPIVAGESAVAGLAGFLLANADRDLRARLALDRSSRILTFGTEGATDPEVYARVVGYCPDNVARSAERGE